VKHLHLDPLGGLAGDMFNAALIDAFPEYEVGAIAAAESVADVRCLASPHRDHVLTGRRFVVRESAAQGDSQGGPQGGSHADAHADLHHDHTTWREIRGRIEASSLTAGVKRHAVGIFARLADAEARVHGVEVEAVSFHEVASVDSIADIVAAAWLIDALDGAAWSVGPLPLGSGQVRTAHGVMPVPAPATARLLEGFAVIDDGIAGERVTPTGAAILRHLAPVSRTGLTGRIARSGFGFGTRRLPGTSNVLRVLALEAQPVRPHAGTHRDLVVIGFEVDDQSAEDLAAGLDRLRTLPGVYDVLQMPAFGKKGRMAAHVQVLVRPEALAAATEACFRETTTIGLRTHLVQGQALERDVREVMVDGTRVRVKDVDRPGGRTSKAESDDTLLLAGHEARARLRQKAEQASVGTDA
jgi:uncharacterized protein (TIGR00299 family) protein